MKITRSSRKNKQWQVTVGNKTIHFGDPNSRTYPGTKRGDSYCARSWGITSNNGMKTANDIKSPNYWSRKMWRCKGKVSLR